jgi:glutamate synthase (NADPH/NADH) small chain
MEYLLQRNRAVAAEQGRPTRPAEHAITAADRHVVVIGGGDTAADCVASAHREGAASVTQLDIYPPASGEHAWEFARWPEHPKRKPSTYALDEGGELKPQLSSTEFVGEDGRVVAVRAEVVGLPPDLEPTGEETQLRADLVLVAIGFTGAEPKLAEAFAFELDDRGRIPGEPGEGVFATGDGHIGQSLIVTAIAEGRECAAAVDAYLA